MTRKASRRTLLKSGVAAGATLALPAGCVLSGSTAQPISPEKIYDRHETGTTIVNALMRPFGVIGESIAAIFALASGSIAKARLARAEVQATTLYAKASGWAVGEGTTRASEWFSSVPALDGPYEAAVERLLGYGPDSEYYTDIGVPYFPVVAGTHRNGAVEGQVFYSEAHGRMKFLLAPGNTGRTIVHPIPETLARLYMDPEKCFGFPISDPRWTKCAYCGAPQVSQRFVNAKGVIVTYEDPSSHEQTTCQHERSGKHIPDKCPWRIATEDGAAASTCEIKE